MREVIHITDDDNARYNETVDAYKAMNYTETDSGYDGKEGLWFSTLVGAEE